MNDAVESLSARTGTVRGGCDSARTMAYSRRPLMVLHVLDDLDTGGAERQVTAFILRSDAGRFRHEICALSESGRFAADLAAAGVPIHILGVKAGSDLVQATVRLRRLVRKVDPDVIHATLYRPGIAGRVVGRLCGKPVVTSLVNTTYEPEWRLDNPRLVSWKVWATRMVDGVSARRWGTRFVAITESVKTSAVRQLGLPRGRITVIPRGLSFDGPQISVDADAQAARLALGLAGAYPIILNVARLVPQKGQQYAIQAMKDVLPEFPTARLLIAGEGWFRPALERLIRAHGLERHVTLMGERHDVQALLRMADIFVFPSLFEGAGNALLEAMAAEKPCVVSRIPTLREVTGDGKAALLADLQSPASLAAGLLRLAKDREMAERLGGTARAWVREHYDIRRSVVALETLYEDLVASQRIHAPGSR